MPNPFDTNKPWEEKGNKWWDWMVSYFQWWNETKPDSGRATEAAQFYAAVYGSWGWKTHWQLWLKGVR